MAHYEHATLDDLDAIRERVEKSPPNSQLHYLLATVYDDRSALLAEVDRLSARVADLEAGIRHHRRTKTPKTPEARRPPYGLPNFADQGLWALLDDEEATK